MKPQARDAKMSHLGRLSLNPPQRTISIRKFISLSIKFPTQRRMSRCRARPFGNDDNDWHEESIDIDQLAARLSAEAERLRRMQDEDDISPGDDSIGSGPPSIAADPLTLGRSPFGDESKSQEADILASIGDGGFSASEFELLQELGQISIQHVEASSTFEGTNPMAAPQRTARAAVIAYTSSYFSGMPFQDPVVTFLKEYLPGAKAIACNELQIMKHLQGGLPDVTDKWKVAAAPLSQNPPIVEVLGYFLASPSERATIAEPAIAAVQASSREADTIWVVSKWEGMAPLALYPGTQQTSGMGLGRLFSLAGGGKNGVPRDRLQMLRAIAGGTLRALYHVHARNVIHGSLGSGSVLLSTFNDQEWARLVVKLDNFGFARHIRGGVLKQAALYPSPVAADDAEDSPFALGQRGDRRQLAIVLLEAILSALSCTGSTDGTSAEAVQRVLGDVYGWDMAQYRRYVEEEPDWSAAAELLGEDNNAGWALMQALVEGRHGVTELLEWPFVRV